MIKKISIRFIIVITIVALMYFGYLILFGLNFGAGSGYGILVNSDSIRLTQQYKTQYLERYADTLLEKFPEYRIPDTINVPTIENYPQENRTDTFYNYPGYLNDICFYIASKPREIYCIQWHNGGSGFYIRTVEDLDNYIRYEEYSHQEPVSVEQKKRIEKRFMKEIYAKLDSLIQHSQEYDSALYINN